MQIEINIPAPCEKALEILERHGYEAYLVGGCVRDSILGREPGDWDICTNALPEEMIAAFADYRLVLNGLKHGTVTVIIMHTAIEITTYRIDGEYEDNRHPKEVTFTSDLALDLSRRDFTINALAYNQGKGVVDCFGGLEDLANGVIKAVGDPYKRFHEDGLRILRAVRFACVLGFTYDERTKDAVRDGNYLLRNIATERIQVELNKILLSPNVRQGLEDMYQLGLYSYFLPEMCHTYGFAQHNPFNCYDVFGHIVRSVELIEPDLTLRLTMFLHDIGKPFVWEECFDGNDCFPLHEIPSAEIAEKFLEQMHYDKKTSKEVVKLILAHNDHILDDDYSIRMELNKMGAESLGRLLQVKIADMGAKNEEMKSMTPFFAQLRARMDTIIARGDCYQISQLAVNGNDLRALGYEGAKIGEMLAYLLAEILKAPTLNERDTLLEMLRLG